jgi:tetratricopeptide (TPR) repeat protein
MSVVPGATRARGALQTGAAAALLIAVSLAVFGPGLGYPFVALDDLYHVVENPAIRDLSWNGIREIFAGDARDIRYYPLTYLSYAVDYRLFGLDAFAFHRTNLALHVASALAVAALVWGVLRDAAVAWVTALLFAIHPLQVEPVAWVMGRKSLLSALCFFLGAIAWLGWVRAERGHPLRRAGALGACLVGYLASCLAKATGITLPAVLVGIEACREPGALRSAVRAPGAFLRGSLPSKLVFVPPAVAIAVATASAAPRNPFAAEYAYAWHEWVALTGYAFWFFVEKLVLPSGLAAFYPLPAPGAVPLRFYAHTAGAVALAAGAVLAARHGRRALAFGLGWYFVTLLPSALILALYSDLPLLVADRYFYASAPGLFLPVAAGACALWRRRPAWRPWLAPAGGAALAALALLAAEQRSTWRSTTAVYEQILAYHPSDEFYYRLALEYDATGRTAEAFRALDAAKRAPHRIFYMRFCYYQLQLAELERRKGDLPAAAARFEAAIESTPNPLEPSDARTPIAYLYLASLRERAGDAAGAARARAAAAGATADPDHYFERTWLAVAPEEARRFLARYGY